MKTLLSRNKRQIIAMVGMLLFSTTYAQLSPPGLGKANTASWFAFGIKQRLDTLKQKESTTYIGIGRKSNPDENNPMSKPGILVLNEEISNHYKEHWTYSYALSYRRSNLYASEAPFDETEPSIEQEFRVYGRYSYLMGNQNIKWKNTVRQEFRKFFNPDFSKTDENYQFRTRLKSQVNFALGTQKVHQIIVSAEALFAISRENFPEEEWSKFAYKESRFALYYSLSPKEIPFTFDLGYMYNLIGKDSNVDGVNYLALDVVLKNPFGN